MRRLQAYAVGGRFKTLLSSAAKLGLNFKVLASQCLAMSSWMCVLKSCTAPVQAIVPGDAASRCLLRIPRYWI